MEYGCDVCCSISFGPHGVYRMVSSVYRIFRDILGDSPHSS